MRMPTIRKIGVAMALFLGVISMAPHAPTQNVGNVTTVGVTCADGSNHGPGFDCRSYLCSIGWAQACPSGGSTNANAAMIQSMAPALQNLFTPIGQALANALFGNPQQEQQRLQQMQQLQAQEAARRAEEERQRAAERKRKLEEIHQRLLSGLKWLDTGGAFAELSEKSLGNSSVGTSLAPKGLDDAALAPSGTSFFGLGGGAPLLNPVNVRRGAYLAEVAINAPPGDAAVLIDEALRVAEGATPFVQIPDNKLPVINEDGLRAFQQANIDYRKAHDDTVRASQQLFDARRNRDIAAEALRRLPEQHDALEQIGKIQQDIIAKQLQESVRRLNEQAEISLRQLRYTEDVVTWEDSLRRLALRALVDKDPALNDLLKREADPQSPAFKTLIHDAYELYSTGSTPEEKLRGKAALEKARQDAVEDLRAQLHRAAPEEWRRAVLTATTAHASPPENAEDTIAFIREAQDHCVGKNRFCAAAYASAHKNDDSTRYLSRRNAEHYLFAKELAESRRYGVASGVAGLAEVWVTAPVYSTVKAVWLGSRFANSPPSLQEVKWADWGAVVGLTGKLDPLK